MRGDTVKVLIDAGEGPPIAHEIRANKIGRTLQVSTGRGMIEVSEMGKSGKVVRSARFMASRVISLVEELAE